MRRLLFFLAAAGLCFGTVRADETVRELQVQLKKAGFYPGELNGQYDNETSAAVSRYQIRNGLPISGKMDAATFKALHVELPPERSPATEPAASGVWRQLRNGEMQFVRKPSSGDVPPSRRGSPSPGRVVDSSVAIRPNEKPTIDPHAPPPRLAEDAPDVQSTAPELTVASNSADPYNREHLRDYVAAFVLAGLDPKVGAEAEFFAERVNYFGQPNVSREKIRSDLLRYDKRWPQRQFRLAGDLQTMLQPNGIVRVTFPLQYELHNGSKSALGTVRKTILLRKTNELDLEIVGVSELRNRR